MVTDLSITDRCNLEKFLSDLSVSFTIDEYNKYISELHQVNHDRLRNINFIKMAEIYNSKKGEIQTIMTPTHHNVYYSKEPFSAINRVWHQLEKGIRLILDYENSNNMIFDMCMKLRFDTNIIDPLFYPHVPDGDIIDKLTFNTSIRSKLHSTMAVLGISTLEEYANFLQENPIQFPNYISKYPESSFGIYFFNNYISIKNILNGSADIIYSFVDHLYFGKRNIFIKLINIFKEFGCIESELNQRGLQAFFSTEGQMLVYCFNNGITPLMYTNHSLFETSLS